MNIIIRGMMITGKVDEDRYIYGDYKNIDYEFIKSIKYKIRSKKLYNGVFEQIKTDRRLKLKLIEYTHVLVDTLKILEQNPQMKLNYQQLSFEEMLGISINSELIRDITYIKECNINNSINIKQILDIKTSKFDLIG